MMRWRIVQILIMAIMVWPCYALEIVATDTEIRRAVQYYCETELRGGDPDLREKIIRFSPEHEKAIKRLRPDEWIYVDYSLGDREIVVSGYTIEHIKQIAKNKAQASIRYFRLGKLGSDLTNRHNYTIEKANEELVILNLVFADKQWWVIDPPPPRMSKNTLIEYYRDKLASYPAKHCEVDSYDALQYANCHAYVDLQRQALELLRSLK